MEDEKKVDGGQGKKNNTLYGVERILEKRDLKIRFLFTIKFS